MSNEAEIAKLIGVMALTYPNIQIADATIEAYVAMLKDVPLDVLSVSIEQCTAESEFFPTIAKVRDRALSLVRPERKDPLEAWGVVLETIGRVGFYRAPSFDDPLIARAVECMGWQYLCSSENVVADRAHFAKIYEQLRDREVRDSRLLPQARALRALSSSGVKEIGNGRAL